MSARRPKGKPKMTKGMAETLRKLIERTGKPVTTVARESGIPQPVLHRFVHGERTLTLETADKLVAYFDLELRAKGRKSI